MTTAATMEAGQELDVRVTAKVMGWTQIASPLPMFFDDEGRAHYFHDTIERREAVFIFTHPGAFLPSTDIAAATAVEDRIFALGLGEAYCECLCEETFGDQWPSPHFTTAEVVALVRATPLQRCRAALAAMELGA